MLIRQVETLLLEKGVLELRVAHPSRSILSSLEATKDALDFCEITLCAFDSRAAGVWALD